MSRISIITICFNNLAELQATCASVDEQTDLPFEHVIVNGSTLPDIKDWLEQTPQPPYRKWINERDHGIGDAFNKGIGMASGEVVNMLNSGDTYFDNSCLATVNSLFAADALLQWLHGKYRIYRGGKWVVIGKPFEKGKLYRGMRSICHQTMFVKKQLHRRHGLYNNDRKIGMDYDFLIRIRDEKMVFTTQPLVSFAPEGVSQRKYLESLKEGSAIYRSYFGNTLQHRLWQWRLKMLYYLLNSPVGKLLYRIKVWLKLENM